MKRKFVIIGVARSGSSLVARTISEFVDNAYCFNETEMNSSEVDNYLDRMKSDLCLKVAVLDRRYTDTVRGCSELELEVVHKTFDRNSVIGLKGNNVLDFASMVRAGYTVICTIRDPVYTLASWTEAGVTPWNRVTDDNMDVWWGANRVKFRTDTLHERQAELWNRFADEILLFWAGCPEQVSVWKYEEFVRNPTGHLALFHERWGLGVRNCQPFDNMNQDYRFQCLDEVRKVVDRMCPIRKEFGYV